MRDYFNTKTIYIGGDRYCVYCGELAQNTYDFDYDGREKIDYYFCNCENAKLERGLEFKLNRIQNEINGLKQDKNKINELQYNYEVKCLKSKYKIV